MKVSFTLCGAALFALAGLLTPAAAATITVTVPGPIDVRGSVGCGLFAGERGFPMGSSVAKTQWLVAQSGGVTCVFRDVADGTYAVSVVLDQNGNQRVDTNPMGMPVEEWGVSNNVQPAMRAPRFNEAAFSVSEDRPVEISVRLHR